MLKKFADLTVGFSNFPLDFHIKLVDNELLMRKSRLFFYIPLALFSLLIISSRLHVYGALPPSGAPSPTIPSGLYLNSASGLNCNTICSRQNRICSSVGINASGNDNSRLVWLTDHCAISTNSTCATVMVNNSTHSCSSWPADWTYCKCISKPTSTPRPYATLTPTATRTPSPQTPTLTPIPNCRGLVYTKTPSNPTTQTDVVVDISRADAQYCPGRTNWNNIGYKIDNSVYNGITLVGQTGYRVSLGKLAVGNHTFQLGVNCTGSGTTASCACFCYNTIITVGSGTTPTLSVTPRPSATVMPAPTDIVSCTCATTKKCSSACKDWQGIILSNFACETRENCRNNYARTVGDATGDNKTCGVDYIEVQNSFSNLYRTNREKFLRSDFNGDGEVGSLDMRIFQTNFDTTKCETF